MIIMVKMQWLSSVSTVASKRDNNQNLYNTKKPLILR